MSRDVLTDAELVQQHLTGNASAFAELYVRHLPSLIRSIRRRVANVETAEDLAQDTFAKALVSLHSLREPARFYQWLTSISRHLINRHYRRASDRYLPDRFDWIDSAEGPDLQVIKTLDHANIGVALGRLHQRHREILQLREAEYRTYSEIATVLGISEATVPPLLHRARRALRREYFAVARAPSGRTFSLAAVLPWLVTRAIRARDRATTLLAQLPEWGVVCGGVACIALTLGFFITTPGTTGAENTHTGRSIGLSSKYRNTDQSASDVRRGSLQPFALHPKPNEVPSSSVLGIAGVRTGPSEIRYDQDYAREHMPYYYEVGPVWFGADPEQMRKDLTGTLDGETGWMGDADPNRRDP